MKDLIRAVTPVGVRIVSRYLAGIIAGAGIASAATGEAVVGDPAVQAFLALLISGGLTAAVEGAYALAKRRGDPT